MSKICNNCLSPAPPDTEHRVAGKVVCHDCVIEYKLTPDSPTTATDELYKIAETLEAKAQLHKATEPEAAELIRQASVSVLLAIKTILSRPQTKEPQP